MSLTKEQREAIQEVARHAVKMVESNGAAARGTLDATVVGGDGARRVSPEQLAEIASGPEERIAGSLLSAIGQLEMMLGRKHSAEQLEFVTSGAISAMAFALEWPALAQAVLTGVEGGVSRESYAIELGLAVGAALTEAGY